MIALLAFGGTSHAQNISTFLHDVIRGPKEELVQLEHRIYHLEIARELAYRTLMLNRCRNFQNLVENPRFDEFGEAILNEMGSPDPDVLTIFTAAGRIQDATIQNALTDAQITIIKRIMESPHYGDFIEYLSFERAESEIADGFEDVNTGKKAPWIAAAALSYLQQSKIFPLLLANANAEDQAMLNRRDIDGLIQSQRTAVDDKYLQSLTDFFEKQLDSESLREKLQIEIQYLLTLYKTIGIDAMRGDTVLQAESFSAEGALCKSKNAANCIGTEWLASATAMKKKIEYEKYGAAARIMREKFSDLCEIYPK
ncbi:hypothetical protein [Comamonas sp. GB3 AK4-5]|uniref:hypothetical protein n=1 Tax=Comamonas sp. GB3 AK4-5 TaxID=3231487 RepID=UPI00351E7C24